MLGDVLCSIVKSAVDDPVFKVYLAALELLHTITFVMIPAQPASTQARFYTSLAPVISSIMSSCCDTNKRVSTRSVDTMLELLKEPLLNSKIFLKAAFDYAQTNSWRWWLGRLEASFSSFPSSCCRSFLFQLLSVL